jgi:hypothetical protein
MIAYWARLPCAVLGGSIMTSDQKKQERNQTRSTMKQKDLPVDENSMQTKPPGVGPSAGSQQSLQHPTGATGGNARSEGYSQQGDWSSRQQGQRMQARGEEDRLGQPRQSGHGGQEQNQHAGSQESLTGPKGSQQTGASGSQQRGGGPDEPPVDMGSRPSKRDVSRR